MDLRISDIHKSFTDPDRKQQIEVLKGISFAVREGSFVCVIGLSGCGKTSLLRIISGLEHPDSGTVILGAQKILSPVRDIGYIFQKPTLFPWRTVAENIGFGLEIGRLERAERELRVARLLRLVELEGFENFHPKQISGGMKQKAALAMALAVEPKVLLMDEPFVSLDSQTRNHLQESLLHIWTETHKTIIFVTHNVDEALFLADEIVCLTKNPSTVGKVVKVEIPRPRERTSAEINTLRKEILSFLAEERRRTAGRNTIVSKDNASADL